MRFSFVLHTARHTKKPESVPTKSNNNDELLVAALAAVSCCDIMSATDKTADFEVGAVAHVSFRVRCETLSYGEEVYLVAEKDLEMQKVRHCCRVRVSV